MANEGVTARRGRPRDAAVDQRVLDVAWDLLLTGGYAGLNVDEVAERAAVAKTTLYRRWPTKDHLAIAVVTRMIPFVPVPDTGDLCRDLTQFAVGLTANLHRYRTTGSSDGVSAGLAGELVAAAARHPDIGDLIRSAARAAACHGAGPAAASQPAGGAPPGYRPWPPDRPDIRPDLLPGPDHRGDHRPELRRAPGQGRRSPAPSSRWRGPGSGARSRRHPAPCDRCSPGAPGTQSSSFSKCTVVPARPLPVSRRLSVTASMIFRPRPCSAVSGTGPLGGGRDRAVAAVRHLDHAPAVCGPGHHLVLLLRPRVQDHVGTRLAEGKGDVGPGIGGHPEGLQATVENLAADRHAGGIAWHEQHHLELHVLHLPAAAHAFRHPALATSQHSRSLTLRLSRSARRGARPAMPAPGTGPRRSRANVVT